MSACARPFNISLKKKRRKTIFDFFFQLVPNCELDQKNKDLKCIFSQVNVVLYQQMIKRRKYDQVVLSFM